MLLQVWDLGSIDHTWTMDLVLLSVRYSVVCGRLAHVPMSLWARTSVLDKCQVEMFIGDLSVKDLAKDTCG